jgi:hypothetical protein
MVVVYCENFWRSIDSLQDAHDAEGHVFYVADGGADDMKGASGRASDFSFIHVNSMVFSSAKQLLIKKYSHRTQFCLKYAQI